MPTWVESRAKRVNHYLERSGVAPSSRTHTLPGDASTRRYVRVITPGRTSRLLLVHPGPIDPETLPFLNVSGLLRQMGVRVPAIVRCEAALGIVEIEDLGDVTLQAFLSAATAAERTACYAEAVSIIDRMQRKGRDLASSDYLPFGLAFDVEKLMWELEFFVTHFLIAARAASPAPADLAALREEFGRLASELASEPRVFCHRDYHSRNLMVHDRHLHVIDFQDARMGPDTYDLVSLLRDCYVEQPVELVDQMIDGYLRLSPTADPVDFRQRFDVMSVQRHLKALGTFGYQSAVARNTRYEHDVPRTLTYLRSVFDQRARFDRLRRLLARYLPELA